MKTIKLLRNVAIRGEGHLAGEVLDVADEDAKTLIQMGKAEPVEWEPEPDPMWPEEKKPAKSRKKAETK